MLRVFVYGTLKPGECNYQCYCLGKVVEEQQAIAFGQLFALPIGYPAMTPGNNKVQGFLLSFTDSTILFELDQLEDYKPNRPLQENNYDRKLIEIFDRLEQPLGTAWAYFMTPEDVKTRGGIFIPSGCWTSS